MAVAIRVGSVVDEVGTDAFFHAFFSTISKHLEPGGWGSRFPELMLKLYQGKLDAGSARKVASDLRIIRDELARFGPDQVVWDIDKPDAKPPWGTNVSAHINSLANYFVTSTGRDLFDVLLEALEALERNGGTLTVEQY
jgi:hypothetical protein